MRTVKRDTYDLNKGKLDDVKALCAAYSAEKRHWVDVFPVTPTKPISKLIA